MQYGRVIMFLKFTSYVMRSLALPIVHLLQKVEKCEIVVLLRGEAYELMIPLQTTMGSVHTVVDHP